MKKQIANENYYQYTNFLQFTLCKKEVLIKTFELGDPTAELSDIIVVLLDKLSDHPDRFEPKCGHSSYNRARNVWETCSANIRYCEKLEVSNAIH